jgi:GMP synthase (glutamine-hydrolysing)
VARVLVVQHIAGEGLGRFADWLPAAGLDVHPIHPYLGHRVPAVVEGDALIVLGGPMSAYDDTAAPWLPEVRSLLRSAVEDGVPTLGVCLGAQLLAVACDGVVDSPAAAGPEYGLVTVEVLADDELLRPGPMPTVAWHHDAVAQLPAGAVVAARNEQFPHQAFRLGDTAWGVQFHAEATAEMVGAWAEASRDGLLAEGRSVDEIVEEVRAAEQALTRAGRDLAERFAALVTG